MQPIKVILAEDNPDALEIIKFYLEQLKTYHIVDICMDGESLVSSVMINKPSLVITDINMPKLSGIDAIKECIQLQEDLKFIFITSYDEYAVQAYELFAVDYVVKPVIRSRLYTALHRAEKLLQTKKRVPVKNNGIHYFLSPDEILFIEKNGKKAIIHTENKIYESYDNMTYFRQLLNSDRFISSHRSYIVNLDKISHVMPKNQTHLIYFGNYPHYAYASKSKVEDLLRTI